MARPIAIADSVAFAFPDVCLTPAPPAPPVPIPYPNIAQLSQASNTSADGGGGVFAGGTAILLEHSEVATSSGDEAGVNGGVTSGTNMGKCVIQSGAASTSVFIHGKGVVRFGDATEQNAGNALGNVLSAFPTVLVGD